MQAINSISKRFFSHIPAQHVQWGIYAVCLITLAGASYAIWLVVSSKFYRKPNPASNQIRTIIPSHQPAPQPTTPLVNVERVLALTENFGKLGKVVTEANISIAADIWRRVAHYLDFKDVLSLSAVCKSLSGLRTDPYVQLLLTGSRSNQIEYFARQLQWFADNKGQNDNTETWATSKQFYVKWPEANKTPASIFDKRGTKICDLPHKSPVINAQWVVNNDALVFVAYADQTIRLWKKDSVQQLIEIPFAGKIVDFWFDSEHKMIYAMVKSNQADPVPFKHSLDCLKYWVGRNLVRLDISKDLKGLEL